jgi:hypothetical protein
VRKEEKIVKQDGPKGMRKRKRMVEHNAGNTGWEVGVGVGVGVRLSWVKFTLTILYLLSYNCATLC